MSTNVNQCRPTDPCQPMSARCRETHLQCQATSASASQQVVNHIWEALLREREKVEHPTFNVWSFLLHIQLYTRERKCQFLRSCNCVDCSGQLASKDQCGQAGRIIFLQVKFSRDLWCLKWSERLKPQLKRIEWSPTWNFSFPANQADPSK